MQFRNAIVEITNKCNFHCAYCYENRRVKNDSFMSLSDFECFVQNTHETIGEYVLSGGEPFLHPDWAEFGKVLRKSGKHLVFISNGSQIEEIVASNMVIDHITLSLDSFCSSWNQMRKGVATLTKGKIEQLKKEERVKKIALQVILSRRNCEKDNIYDILEFCRDNNIGCKFKLMDYYKCNERTQNDALNEKDRWAVWNLIQLFVEKNHQFKKMVEIFPVEGNVFCPCELIGGVPNLRVRSDGKLFPCEKMDDDEFCVGTMLQPLQDILRETENVKRRLIRRIVQRSCKECAECQYNAECNKGCPVLFEQQDMWLRCKEGKNG